MKNTLKDNFYYIIADYSPVFVNAMKSLGGKWMPEDTAWRVDCRNWSQLSAILVDLFGYDGISEYETCTVIIDVNENSNNNIINIGLYHIGKRWNRDSGVSLSEKCSVITGGFCESGGSRNNPKIEAKEGTRIKILDFPCALVPQIKGHFQIIDGIEMLPKEIKISTNDLIEELERRGYEITKKINIPSELIDEN